MATLLFDADCGFCRRALALGSRFLRPEVMAMPLQSYVSDNAELQPDRLREVIRLVTDDGRVFSGAEAIAQSVAGIGRLYYLPGLRWLADQAYVLVARNRSSLPGGCEASSCASDA